MADSMSKEARSKLMASIRSKDTKPELAVRRALHGEGFRYSLHSRAFPGRPDMALRKYRLAIFIHGCFWHGHDCGLVKVPSTQFWRDKIAGNQARDLKSITLLQEMGWEVVTIWECTLERDTKAVLRKLRRQRQRSR